MIDLELDVRPILRDGADPFSAILAAVGQLAPGQRLRLYAPFKPEPLLGVMASRGFVSDATALPEGAWMVIFTPLTPLRAGRDGSPAASPETWPDPLHYRDFAHLAPPAAMEHILAQLDTMGAGAVLFVLLEREPIALYPALEARGHAWIGGVDDTGQAYRMLIRAAGRS